MIPESAGAQATTPVSLRPWQRLEALLLPGWRRALATISLLGLATVFGAAMVFATQTLLARELGPNDYGRFVSSLATVTMIAPLAAFGLTQFRMKVYGVEGWAAHRWIKPSLQFTLATTALAFVILFGWALLFAPHDGTRFDLFVLSPVILCFLAIDLIANKLRLEDNYRAMALWLSLMIPSSRLMVVLLLLLLAQPSATFVACCYGAIALLVAVAGLPHLRVLVRDEIKLRGHGPRSLEALPDAPSPSVYELWSQAWAYGVYAALYPVFFQISTILLKYLDGDAQAGMYSIGLAVMTAIYLIPTTIYQKFLLAKLHRWAAHDRPKFWLVYRQGNIGMLALGVLIAIGLAAASPWIVPLVFGHAYRGVVSILLVLSLCPPLRFLSTAMGSVLLTEDYMRYRVYAISAATLIVIVVNAALIPRFAGVGAAWGTVAGELALLLGTWSSVRLFRREEPDDGGPAVDEPVTP